MSTRTEGPAATGDRPVSDVARRVGPPLAVGSLVLTVAFLAWFAIAPSGIEGPLSEAPFTVPATLVTAPDEDGCLHVVDGDGSSRTHCLERLARQGDGFAYTEAYFDDQGRLLVLHETEMDHERTVLELDPATGEVVAELGDGEDAPYDGRERPPSHEDVYVDGDRVVRVTEDGGPSGDEVVIDLGAPPGYQLHQAVLSPDGAWVVAVTETEEVVVAPTDGSSSPYVWTSLDRGWVDLWRSIRWDD